MAAAVNTSNKRQTAASLIRQPYANSIKMKRLPFFLLLLSCLFSANAQNKDTKPDSRLKVGVVLGGGGAKGASHIGVLKYIEEMGIPVDYVAGTSMGSIVGGFYAMGYSPDELTQLISNINWSEYIGNKNDRQMKSEEVRNRNSTMALLVPFSHESLFDKDPKTTFISQLPNAFVNNSSLINLFNDMCVGYQEDMDFNDMPIPFACVATDMITGKEVVLRKGSVPLAMRASMAIPGVFSPVAIDDMVLVDGGLVNNFPADVLKDMGADIIIGVEVTSTQSVTAADLKSLPQVFARLLITSTSAKRVENRKMCDIHIIPDISGFGMLSFTPEAIDTLVGRGYKSAHTFHDQLLNIKHIVDSSAGHPVSKVLHAPHAKNLACDSVLISSITIDNVSDRDSRWLIRKGGLKVGNRYSEAEIEHVMKIYRGTGCFDNITYQVLENDTSNTTANRLSNTYSLGINVTPAKPHLFGLGVRYDTDEGAGLLLHIGLNDKKFGGSKFDANFKLSYSPRINLTYTFSIPSVANLNLAYEYRNDHFRLKGDGDRGFNSRYQQHKASGYFSQFHLLNFSTAVGVSYTRTSYDNSSIEESSLDSAVFVTNKLLSPFITAKYDNLDDDYFAKHGIFTRLTGLYHVDLSKPNVGYEWIKKNCLDINYTFKAYITPGNWRFTIIPQVYGRFVSDSPTYYNLWNLYGGEKEGCHFDQQIPFIGHTALQEVGDNVTMLRLDVRYNFYGNHYLTAMYNALTAWYLCDVNGLFNPAIYIPTHGAGLKYAYNTPLGPISLTGHWMRNFEGNHFGAYFSFGYSF